MITDKKNCWHLLWKAFDGYEGWKCLAAVLSPETIMTEQEYEDYFYGTNASVFLPLWASVCLEEKASLQNHITLKVVEYYKKTGYEPAFLQKNPVDYIGELCRYMEYMMEMIEEGKAEYRYFAKHFTGEIMESCAAFYKKSLQKLSYVPIDLMKMADFLIEMVFDAEDFAWNPQDGEPVSVALPEAPYETMQASFSDCGKKCKLKATVCEGCVLKIGPDSDYKEKRFTGCVRGHQYRQTFLSPGRLRYPMVRRGKRGEGLFRRITWEEAEQRIAEKIQETQEKYGPASRFVMHSAGVCAASRGDRFMKDLLALSGGLLENYNFYSASCAEHILPYVYGTVLCGNADSEMLNSKLLVLWGHNPADTLWGEDHLHYLAKAKEQGCRIIVIDPRRSATSNEYADQWIGIRPSTDGAFADAVAYEIIKRNLQDQEFCDRFCLGFDEAHMPDGVPKEENYRDYLFGKKDGIVKDADWAEKITGASAEVIVRFAIELATCKPAWIMSGLGPQRTLNGEQNCRSAAMLAALTGNVGKKGGGAGAFQIKGGHLVPYFMWRENPYKGMIPSFLWTKAIDEPEKIDASQGLTGVDSLNCGIKLLFNLAGGMLINQHSDINNTIRVLGQEDKAELIVVSDLFMTPGARYADLLLPGISFFETENMVGAWMPSDYFLYNEPAIRPLFDGRVEYDWIRNVARLLGLDAEFSHGRTQHQWMEHMYEEVRKAEQIPDFEAFTRAGIAYMPYGNEETVGFRKQVEEGVPFDTPSGKIEIFSKRLYDRHDPDLPGIPCYTPCEEGAEDAKQSRYPLQLIGYHSKRYCHSIGDSNRYLDEVHKPCLWMHPENAKERNLHDGDICEIFNDRGCVRIRVRVTDGIVKGCVAMNEGGWFTPDENGVDTRGCINVLTMSHRTTPLAKANPQHTNLVEVRKRE